MEKHRLILCEADTGIVLSKEGERASGLSRPRYEPRFESYDEAVKEAEQLVACFPYAEVWLFVGEKLISRFVDEIRLSAWLDARSRYVKWSLRSPLVRWLCKAPPRPPHHNVR